MKESIIKDKSKEFALRIIKLYKYLTITAVNKEFVLSKQVLRSGTSIGANVKEALRGQSRPDFRAKMSIALKEASESEYWIEILRDTNYISAQQAESMLNDCTEVIKILISIIKTSQGIKNN
jgi:four helix bundle protein